MDVPAVMRSKAFSRSVAAVLAACAPLSVAAGDLDEFNRFDKDTSGYLSRQEMAECGCAALDTNGDLILMPAEFLAASASANQAALSAPAPTDDPASPQRTESSGAWKAGMTVRAGCYGNMKPGFIEYFVGGQAWVSFADEPHCDGLRDVDSLKLDESAASASRSDMTSSGGSMPPDGVYVCQKISGSALIGLGNLEIRDSSYAGIGGDDFNALESGRDGTIRFAAGLEGLPEGWTITESRYAGTDSLGRPMIRIAYRTVRNDADVIDCIRE